MSMNLRLSSIKLSNGNEAVNDTDGKPLFAGKPESLLVSVCARNDTKEGNLDVCFEVEIKNFRSMTIAEIESEAVLRASTLLISGS